MDRGVRNGPFQGVMNSDFSCFFIVFSLCFCFRFSCSSFVCSLCFFFFLFSIFENVLFFPFSVVRADTQTGKNRRKLLVVKNDDFIVKIRFLGLGGQRERGGGWEWPISG